MKRIVVLMTAAACLLLGVEMVLAQSNNANKGENVEPNVKPGRVESRDSNDSASKAQEQQRERLREGARDRIREIAQQRRQGRIGEGQQPVDSNQQSKDKNEQRRIAERRAERARDANQPTGATLEEKGVSGDMRNRQLRAVGKQIAREENKHRERLAKLNRIRELAQQTGDTKILERADKLVEKQMQRYDVRSQRMQTRQKKILDFAKKEADVNKPVDLNAVGISIEEMQEEDKSDQ